MALTFDSGPVNRRLAWSARRTLAVVTVSSLILWAGMASVLFFVLRIAG